MKLEIKDIDVITKDKKEILRNFNLSIGNGEIHVIMGPNGTGKSTLSKVIMGSKDYTIKNGDILFENESIKDLETDIIANKGIFLAMQNPISIEGISNSEFLKTAVSNKRQTKVGIYEFMKDMEQAMNDLDMDQKMMHRSINQDFSGGERKKNEILQMKLLKPSLLILDELDSGLDVDNLKIVCKNINNYLNENKDVSLLIITHYPKILEYLKPNYVHIMMNGNIVKTGDFSLAKELEKNGFSMFNELNQNN